MVPPELDASDRRGLPRSRRIRRGRQIREILTKGRRHRFPHLDVYSVPAMEGSSRFGAIVPRYGRSAVVRNRLRRRLKEIGRTAVLPAVDRVGRQVDVLVRSRPSAYGASFSQLEAELVQVTERLCSDASSSV